MKTNRVRAALLVALTVLGTGLGAGGLDAQQRPRAGQQGPPDREEMQRRIQARFGEIVQQQLGLDRERGARLLEVIRDSEQGRRDLAGREIALRERLRGQASLEPRSEPAPLMDEDDARDVLEEMREIQEAEAALYLQEQERLLEVLTPGQLVRFYALREALAHRVQRLRGGPGDRPGGGPGGPGGPPHPRSPGR